MRLCHVENWPSGKLQFDCQKIAQNLTFFQKNWQKLSFFHQNCHWQFCWKKLKFLAFFLEKCQVLGNFLTFKWQFSGGSGLVLCAMSALTWVVPWFGSSQPEPSGKSSTDALRQTPPGGEGGTTSGHCRTGHWSVLDWPTELALQQISAWLGLVGAGWGWLGRGIHCC